MKVSSVFSKISATVAAIAMAPASAKILMAGDSTMAQWASTIQGWGVPFAQYMSLTVVNLAHGGRSARSYTREGDWHNLVNQIEKGDYVIIEFGHNDGGTPAGSDRAPTLGSGTEATTVTLSNGTVEVVQTFVTYEKWMVQGIITAGGIPVVSSTTPNGDYWNSAHTAMLGGNRFVPYSSYAAGNYTSQGATWVDHYGYVAIAYGNLGYANVYPALFPIDHTHTNSAGADVVAKAFVNGLKCQNHTLANYLTAAGQAIPKVCRPSSTSTAVPAAPAAPASTTVTSAEPVSTGVVAEYGQGGGVNVHLPPGPHRDAKIDARYWINLHF